MNRFSALPLLAVAAAPAPVPLPATQAALDRLVRQQQLPGVVVAIGRGDEDPVFLSAGKIADGPAPAAGPDALWRIYSMTKPIAGMAIMLLIEQGKIALDDPVAKYIPAFGRMRVLVHPDTSLEARAARTPITIRMLLTHTAGLGYPLATRGPLLREYERLGIVPLQINTALEGKVRPTRPTTLADFAARVASLPLVAEPGTRWQYSLSFDVLGRVVEVAAGMPFDRFLQEGFFTPLKMSSTYFTVPAGQASRLATNYAPFGSFRAPIDPGGASVFLRRPSFPYGGAGLVSSARDYDRFLHMLANGGELGSVRVMKAETVRLALSDLLPAGLTVPDAAAWGGGTAGQGFGAGGSVRRSNGTDGLSRGTYAWGGAAGTLAWIDPVRRLRGTVMINVMPPPASLRQVVADGLRQDLGADR